MSGGTRPAAPRIELRVERLVLDGLAVEPRDREAVRLAVEAELARLLADGALVEGLAARGGAWGRVRGADVQLVPDAGAAGLGRRIAGAVHQGIGGQP